MRKWIVSFRSSLGILLCAEIVVAADYRQAIQFAASINKDVAGMLITQVVAEEIKA